MNDRELEKIARDAAEELIGPTLPVCDTDPEPQAGVMYTFYAVETNVTATVWVSVSGEVMDVEVDE